MNVSPVLASSQTAKIASAVDNLYSSTAAASTSAAAPATRAGGADAVVTLSNRAIDLMQRREVSEEAAQRFKDILAKANAANAAADPKTFLYSLSAADMEVLRKVHSLADTIDISTLSKEGAANLLVQPGSAQDLDNNGLTSIGAANMFTFPPQNAPQSFKDAWAAASAGMSELDIPTHMIFAVGLANIGREPGDPNWRNPYADPGYDYKGAVDSIIGSLKYQFAHNMIPAEQYRLDMGFYSRLTNAMG